MLIFLIIYTEACTTSTEFTECSNNTMAVIITPDTNCSDPTPYIHGHLPCNFSCPAGQKLDFLYTSNTLTCSLCPAGTYSLGGGHDYSSFNTFKDNFHSNCWVLDSAGWNLSSECTSWHSNSDTFLISGSGPPGKWYETDLTFYPRLIKDGYLEINYRKDSTMVLGVEIGEFYIFIDEILEYYDYSVDNFDWKVTKIPMLEGIHRVQVVFDKFVSDQIAEAQIRSIKVIGTKFADFECKKCQSGHSPAGSDFCTYCEIGSYLDELSGICKACPQGTTSYPGSQSIDQCFEALICKDSDWHYYYSECIEGKQEKVYEWNEPIMCDSNDIWLPDNEIIECVPCGPGKQYVYNKCEYCPTGNYNSDGKYGESCKSCQAGTYAAKISDYFSWTEFPAEFTTGCIVPGNQQCRYDWETRGTYIVTSPIYPANSDIIIQGQFDIAEQNASVSFEFSVFGLKTEFLFIVNNILVFNSTGNKEKSFESFGLGIGKMYLKWICRHHEKDMESCSLFRVTVDGTGFGGAAKCLNCAKGSVSKISAENCEICGNGLTSNIDNTECVGCPLNMFLDFQGNCQYCVNGLTIGKDNDTCVLADPKIQIENSTYSLFNLSGTPGNPPFYCSEQKLQMYCYETFYGPVQGDSHYFYLSIFNPSEVIMPNYPQVFNGKAYSFAVIDTNNFEIDSFYLNKPEENCDEKYSKILVSIGGQVKSIENDKEFGHGLKLIYDNGDICKNGTTFNTIIHLSCDKEEEEGWPIFLKYENCTFEFYWPTVTGCELCTESQKILQNSTCENNQKTIHEFEGEFCIFENRSGYIKSSEPCNENKVYKSWPFIMSLLVSGIMLFVVSFTMILACKKRSGYQKLIQFRQDTKKIEMSDNK